MKDQDDSYEDELLSSADPLNEVGFPDTQLLTSANIESALTSFLNPGRLIWQIIYRISL